MYATDRLYIYSNGKVAALNKKDGSIVWEINLNTYVSYTRHAVGQITVEDGKLFISVSGRVICLSAKDGALLWANELKGWGYYFVSMANVSNEANVASANASAATATVISST